MHISMHALSVESFALMLRNLLGVLDKAAAHAQQKGLDASVLVNARLAPDMFPFHRQVQVVCVQAEDSVSRLMGKEPPRPEFVEEPLDALKARIQRTIDALEKVPASALEGTEDRDISAQLREDLVLELKGLAYIKDWTLPNFYFHLVTAYDILRHSGVELSKVDYIAGMAPAIRKLESGAP